MIPKGRFVTEIGEGDRIKSVFLVSKRNLLTTKTGKPYAKLVLSDMTGEIPGIIWDNAQQQIAAIDPGAVAGVRASTESYDGRLQLRIEKIVKLDESVVDMSTLIPTTKRDITSMMEELDKIINSIQDRHLSLLIHSLFSEKDIRETFIKAPAAKGIHHNYVGGLLEHTLFVLKSIIALYPIYTHIGINKDLLIAGALLHDIGKIYEYSCNKIIDMTPMGRLIGHIYISAHMTDQAIAKIEDFPEELRLQLLHIIISHHGQLEFGSPKLPMSLEALFLHMLDDFDAKLIGFSAIIEATPEEEPFSAFSKIYNRYLYTQLYENESS